MHDTPILQLKLTSIFSFLLVAWFEPYYQQRDKISRNKYLGSHIHQDRTHIVSYLPSQIGITMLQWISLV